MATIETERVLSVKHWNDRLFSFTTTRDPSFRFRNGQFVMVGLEVDGKPLLRAYSIASANYEEELEFFSIKVPDGPLTSRLQNIQAGDQVLLSRKPTGTLLVDDLRPAKRLYLLATGTGLAPFLSIIKDFEIYEQFEQIILVHGVRTVSELAYQTLIEHELPQNEFFGDWVKQKLRYYPTVTRETFKNQGRITHLIETGKLFDDLNLPRPNIEDDRFMICGSIAMLKDLTTLISEMGFRESKQGDQFEFVIERAFVD